MNEKVENLKVIFNDNYIILKKTILDYYSKNEKFEIIQKLLNINLLSINYDNLDIIKNNDKFTIYIYDYFIDVLTGLKILNNIYVNDNIDSDIKLLNKIKNKFNIHDKLLDNIYYENVYEYLYDLYNKIFNIIQIESFTYIDLAKQIDINFKENNYQQFTINNLKNELMNHNNIYISNSDNLYEKHTFKLFELIIFSINNIYKLYSKFDSIIHKDLKIKLLDINSIYDLIVRYFKNVSRVEKDIQELDLAFRYDISDIEEDNISNVEYKNIDYPLIIYIIEYDNIIPINVYESNDDCIKYIDKDTNLPVYMYDININKYIKYNKYLHPYFLFKLIDDNITILSYDEQLYNNYININYVYNDKYNIYIFKNMLDVFYINKFFNNKEKNNIINKIENVNNDMNIIINNKFEKTINIPNIILINNDNMTLNKNNNIPVISDNYEKINHEKIILNKHETLYGTENNIKFSNNLLTIQNAKKYNIFNNDENDNITYNYICKIDNDNLHFNITYVNKLYYIYFYKDILITKIIKTLIPYITHINNNTLLPHNIYDYNMDDYILFNKYLHPNIYNIYKKNNKYILHIYDKINYKYYNYINKNYIYNNNKYTLKKKKKDINDKKIVETIFKSVDYGQYDINIVNLISKNNGFKIENFIDKITDKYIKNNILYLMINNNIHYITFKTNINIIKNSNIIPIVNDNNVPLIVYDFNYLNYIEYNEKLHINVKILNNFLIKINSIQKNNLNLNYIYEYIYFNKIKNKYEHKNEYIFNKHYDYIKTKISPKIIYNNNILKNYNFDVDNKVYYKNNKIFALYDKNIKEYIYYNLNLHKHYIIVNNKININNAKNIYTYNKKIKKYILTSENKNYDIKSKQYSENRYIKNNIKNKLYKSIEQYKMSINKSNYIIYLNIYNHENKDYIFNTENYMYSNKSKLPYINIKTEQIVAVYDENINNYIMYNNILHTNFITKRLYSKLYIIQINNNKYVYLDNFNLYIHVDYLRILNKHVIIYDNKYIPLYNLKNNIINVIEFKNFESCILINHNFHFDIINNKIVSLYFKPLNTFIYYDENIFKYNITFNSINLSINYFMFKFNNNNVKFVNNNYIYNNIIIETKTFSIEEYKDVNNIEPILLIYENIQIYYNFNDNIIISTYDDNFETFIYYNEHVCKIYFNYININSKISVTKKDNKNQYVKQNNYYINENGDIKYMHIYNFSNDKDLIFIINNIENIFCYVDIYNNIITVYDKSVNNFVMYDKDIHNYKINSKNINNINKIQNLKNIKNKYNLIKNYININKQINYELYYVDVTLNITSNDLIYFNVANILIKESFLLNINKHYLIKETDYLNINNFINNEDEINLYNNVDSYENNIIKYNFNNYLVIQDNKKTEQCCDEQFINEFDNMSIGDSLTSEVNNPLKDDFDINEEYLHSTNELTKQYNEEDVLFNSEYDI